MKYKAICIDNSNTNLILYKKYTIKNHYPSVYDVYNDSGI